MEFLKRVWAFLVARVNDIMQIAVAGGATAAAAPFVVDDISAASAGLAAVVGRLLGYAKVVTNLPPKA